MLIRAALGLALFQTLALAAVLWAWSDRVAGGRLLAAFLVGIAVWITGNELPNWLGIEAESWALHLLGTAAFTSALFFHFCVVFCRVSVGRYGVAAAYALGGGAALLAQVLVPARLVWTPYVGWVGVAEPVGWLVSMAWVILGVAGVSVLLRGWARAQPPVRQQIAAVSISCIWGLLCLSGYALVLLDLPVFPFPLLLLPLYPVILVYGVLRYGVFVANAWAGRALVWALLLALGGAIVALVPLLLPFESRWLSGLAVAASCLALSGPVRRFAHRLIYPGGEVSAADLDGWRRALMTAETFDVLSEQASLQLSQRLGTPVRVMVVNHEASPFPSLVAQGSAEGWQMQLLGWEAAPPGQRHVAELFGRLVLEAAARVEQGLGLAARERERQLQARLAELGALAATVAHDIRNPLNIISMAVASSPPDTRREVTEQIGRIAHLTRDLLDFAKPWKLNPAETDVSSLVRRLALREPGLQMGPGLQQPLFWNLDSARLEQALINLIENARIALQAQAEGGVYIDAELRAEGLWLRVCDNGPGVPPELRDRLFEPFASRSPGGTGLGLAIVARIAAAHGGSVQLSEHAGWRTCFSLQFPKIDET